MPGIDTGAPERTADQQRLRSVAERALRELFDLRERRAHLGVEAVVGYLFAPCPITKRHTSVVMVKPGGTGRPSDAITARLAPLTPSNALSFARPSAAPPLERFHERFTRKLRRAGSRRSACTV